jgi:hypothetical protein
MDTPKNRMLPPKPKTTEAPVVVVPGRVCPCVCPACGKAQQPLVRRTMAVDGYSDVSCSACAKHFRYHYSSPTSPARISYR